MLKFSNIETVVFDFDGTLVDSNKIKRESFLLLDERREFQEHMEMVLQSYPESSRYEVIKMALQNSDLEYSEEVLHKYIGKYAEIVERQIVEMPLIDSALELLTLLKEKRINLILSSNTPIESLKRIMMKRSDLDSFFLNFFGYPSKKEQTLKTLITNSGTHPDHFLVVGDGVSDELSAKDNNVQFFNVNKSKLKDLLRLFQNA